MQDGLSTELVIFVFLFLVFLGIIFTFMPLVTLKILIKWPKILIKILHLDYSTKYADLIKRLDSDPSAYKVENKHQLEILRVTGGIAFILAFGMICGLLPRIK